MTSLRSRAIRGSAISIGAKLAEQILRLGSNLILTRLLFPEAFGLMALINTLMMGLEMLSDVGVRLSIIQHARGEEKAFLDTAFTIGVIRGGVIWVVGSLAAWPFALLVDKPEVIPFIPVATLVGLINGAISSKLGVYTRRIQLGRIALITIGGQLIGLTAMALLALELRSVWALVFGTIITAASTCILSHVALPGPRDRFHWDREAAREIVNFGKWIFVSTTITFLAIRLDILLLGRMVPLDVLGVYSMGTMLAALPMMLGGQIIGSVLLPALAEGHRQSHQALVLTFKKARRVILPAGAYLCLGVALGAPAFFNYLYDSRYHDAAWITPLLMVGAWFVFLQEASGRALQAMGNARALAAANFVKLLVTAAACVAGHRLAGMLGFLIGAGLGAFSGHLVTMVMLARARLPAGWDDLAFSAGAAAIAAAGVIVPRYLAPRLELSLPLVSLGVAVVILAPLGGAVGWWTLREAKGRR